MQISTEGLEPYLLLLFHFGPFVAKHTERVCKIEGGGVVEGSGRPTPTDSGYRSARSAD